MIAAWLVAIFCMGFFGSLTLSGCAATEQLLNLEQLQHQRAESDASTAPIDAPPAGIKPAPAGMSRAEQNRYYAAQLAAQKQTVPRKQKNSNNTAVTQEVHNGFSTVQLLISWVVSLALGAGITFIVLVAKGWKKPNIISTQLYPDYERRRFDRLMAQKNAQL